MWRAAPRLLLPRVVLIRYCAAHPRHFGYPRLLGVRWNGWVFSTAGGLCEACRERERARWDVDPYGSILIPLPAELGPPALGRRVFAGLIAAAAAAVVTTAALLVVNPSGLIPSGGEPELLSGGARPAGPASAQADTPSERPAASRSPGERRAPPRAVASRAALTNGPSSKTPVTFARGRSTAVVAVAARTTRPSKARPAVTAQAP